MINEALFSSDKMEWETPQALFNKLNKVFDFRLDVAADSENTKCESYYNEEIDGLAQPWEVDRGGFGAILLMGKLLKIG